MRRAVLGGLAALMLIAGPAWSAEPTARARDLSGRYIRAVHLVENLDRMVEGMMPAMLEGAIRNANLSASDERRFREAFNEVGKEVMADYTRKLVAELEVVVAETFTEDELTQAVAFYESPVGRSIVAKTPQLNATFMPRIKPLVDESTRTMFLRMMQKLCPSGTCEPAERKHGA